MNKYIVRETKQLINQSLTKSQINPALLNAANFLMNSFRTNAIYSVLIIRLIVV